MTAIRRRIETLHDRCADALSSIAARPGRASLTVGGTVLGIASLVVTSGVAASDSAKVLRGFDQYRATEVVLREARAGAVVPTDRLAAVRRLDGVTHVGMWCDLTNLSLKLSSSAAGVVDGESTVITVDPDTLSALVPHYTAGTGFNETQAHTVGTVAVVGIGIARALHLPPLQAHPVVSVDGVPFTVVGVLDDVRRRAVALNAVLIPTSAGRRVRATACPVPSEVLTSTRPGAAQAVGSVAARIVSPEVPDRYTADIPPDPRALRRSVEHNLGSLYVVLAIVSMLVGALSIGNTMTVSVLERSAEIGVRRALGFRRRAVAGLFCLESVTIGLIGGLVGSALGVLAVLAVCLSKGWLPTFLTPVLLLAPVLGAATGLIGGLVPALRASRIEPARAVRL